MTIKVKVPATTANLGPGFDCLGVALGLYNEFEVRSQISNYKLQIDVVGEGARFIEKNEQNIVYKAIKKVCDICKKPVPNISLKIVSRIPITRGLGSSASARVAGVVIGNILCGKKLGQGELINIATELEGHPDNVVPALVGGLCVSTKIYSHSFDVIDIESRKKLKCQLRRDFKIGFVKFDMPRDLCALILVPNVYVSTEKARNVLPKVIDYKSAVKNVGNVALLLSSILNKKYLLIKYAMEDFLHQPFRKRIMPWLWGVFNICLKNKALGVALSGSGSSIFVLYEKKDLNKNRAEKIKRLIGKKLKIEYKILNFVKEGTKVVC